MQNYHHAVQYYETDRMGITHHSNYIRWMEEARTDFLKQIGWDYARLEEMGIISPVLSVNCSYKNSTTYGDVVEISVAIVEYRRLRLLIRYEMKDQTGKTVCTAESTHCFLNKDMRPIRVEKEYPEFFKALTDVMTGPEA